MNGILQEIQDAIEMERGNKTIEEVTFETLVGHSLQSVLSSTHDNVGFDASLSLSSRYLFPIIR